MSASVVVAAPFDELGGFDYKVCLVQRTAKAAFMPAVSVFPGGAVDRADSDMAPGDSEVVRIAAIREVFEESGILISEERASALSQSENETWRSRIRESPDRLGELFRIVAAKPGLDTLHPICSFVTPDVEHVRLKKGGFNTAFFLYCATDAAELKHASADASETHDLVWMSPREAVDASDRGDLFLAPPQWYRWAAALPIW